MPLRDLGEHSAKSKLSSGAHCADAACTSIQEDMSSRTDVELKLLLCIDSGLCWTLEHLHALQPHSLRSGYLGIASGQNKQGAGDDERAWAAPSCLLRRI